MPVGLQSTVSQLTWIGLASVDFRFWNCNTIFALKVIARTESRQTLSHQVAKCFAIYGFAFKSRFGSLHDGTHLLY